MKNLIVWIVAAGLALGASADAQVVREEGVTSIAGILGGTYPSDARWIVKSSGNEVIFASLDAEIYRSGMHHDADTVPVAAPAGEDEGGCGDEGGPARFCLQVLGPGGTVICQATRPAPPPGWQRDPRLACVLPASSGQTAYTIRVSLAGPEGTCSELWDPVAATGEAHPFILNVSVRRVAPTGVQLQQAAAVSKNRLD